MNTDTGLTLDRSVDDLHRAVKDHYDKLIDLYEEMWASTSTMATGTPVSRMWRGTAPSGGRSRS